MESSVATRSDHPDYAGYLAHVLSRFHLDILIY